MLRFFNVQFSDVVCMGLKGSMELINFQSFFKTINDWSNALEVWCFDTKSFLFRFFIFSQMKIKNLSIENTNGANDVCWVMTNIFL